jgi:hypothetical protein
MTDPVNAEVTRRLERLELSQRRWQRLAACGVLGLAAVALMGQSGRPATRVVEAERFVLRDAAGHARAELMAEGEQSVALRFKDADGMPRLTLGVENGSALLVLNERGGRLRAGLVALPHGAPGLTFYGTNGKARAEFNLTREGTPALMFSDRDGFETWKTTGR